MTTTSANHETREQSSTPLISEHERDYWENVDGKWKRHHVRPRSRLYRPGAEQRPSEQGPPETLVRGRRTIMQFSDESMMEHHDDWTKGDDELENETRKWTGITEFSNRNEDRNASEEVQDGQHPMILNNSEKHNQHEAFRYHDNRVSTNAKNMN